MLETTIAEAEEGVDTVQGALLDRLDAKLAAVMESVRKSESFSVLSSPQTPQQLVVSILGNVLLDVYSYGKSIVEATFVAIGRMPLEGAGLMRSATTHILDEVSHPNLALRDFAKLGGDEAWARKRRMSPPAFAMAATCRVLSEREDPFSYLGFMYLFESLTPVVAQEAQKFMAARQMSGTGIKFIDLHAVEDIKHIEWMRDLINRVVERYPTSEEAIEYGFDCFRAVYPLPVWERAWQDAQSGTKH